MASPADLERHAELIAVVDRLEAMLRRMRLWETRPPSAAQVASTEPFCFDTLSFPQWLQWQLIPRMRRIFAGDGALPTESAIHPYAVDCVAAIGIESMQLLALIERFDALIRGRPPITAGQSATMH